MRVARMAENSLAERRPDAEKTARGVEGRPWAEARSDPGGQQLIERMVETDNERRPHAETQRRRERQATATGNGEYEYEYEIDRAG